jgi:hypothetical protein
MSIAEDQPAKGWPPWQRVVFRFFFIYLLLQTAPWNWFYPIPGLAAAEDWVVRFANARFFHVRETLIAVNGSGDTSWAYAQALLYLTLAAAGALIWSVLDRKRPHHQTLDYWLRTVLRYYIASAALGYGIIKLYALQMPFPNQSLLSTPLGDLLPMRLSWLFLGYSTTYQMFSGAMETIAGLLLLGRRTVTLGLFAATGAFLNVVMINLSYDVPVKLFASHLLFACLFLLALDAKRLFAFLVLNRPAPASTAYEPPHTRPWHRWASLSLKAVLIVLILVLPLQRGWTQYGAGRNQPELVPFRAGIYDVAQFVVNGDTIPPLVSDSLRWRDVIIDSRLQGSVNTTDSLFWTRYRRGYFRYLADTASQVVHVWKTSAALDSTFLFTMRYEVPDSTRIRLWGLVRDDSLQVELVRSRRHFQLTERQFHWLSEYNR